MGSAVQPPTPLSLTMASLRHSVLLGLVELLQLLAQPAERKRQDSGQGLAVSVFLC